MCVCACGWWAGCVCVRGAGCARACARVFACALGVVGGVCGVRVCACVTHACVRLCVGLKRVVRVCLWVVGVVGVCACCGLRACMCVCVGVGGGGGGCVKVVRVRD